MRSVLILVTLIGNVEMGRLMALPNLNQAKLKQRKLTLLLGITILLTSGLVGCDLSVEWGRDLFFNSRFNSRVNAKSKPKSKLVPPAPFPAKLSCASTQKTPNFFVLGGGGSPEQNEIAIEKNVLYFQRTLKSMRLKPAQPQIYFANGNDGRKTVRYIDPQGKEQFKVPEIPGVLGSATWSNIRNAIDLTAKQQPNQPIFFYFTGHGSHNQADENNNAMILWNDRELSVQQFSTFLDQLPQNVPFVTVMVQCYSGAFANLIYQHGDPSQPIALQTRCGFFATIKQLPSVGCTPEVNEADYQDYSSSFFAGLSGVSRVGRPVASADYNQDGNVSFAEAHAFAKVDEQASDLPISTSEAWLRDRLSEADTNTLLDQPLQTILQTARPEQQYVATTWVKQFKLDPAQSYATNYAKLPRRIQRDEQLDIYLQRLRLELINIAAETAVRQRQDSREIAVLDRLIECEAGFWQPPGQPTGQLTGKPTGQSTGQSTGRSSAAKSRP
jgi:hypothetical protein